VMVVPAGVRGVVVAVVMGPPALDRVDLLLVVEVAASGSGSGGADTHLCCLRTWEGAGEVGGWWFC